jgi:RimJ/RimL family protein N-acetyltransferase
MRGIILKGKRILLRSSLVSDARNYVEWFKDEDVVKYLIEYDFTTLEEGKKYIKKQQAKKIYHFAIVTKRNKRHIGLTSLTVNKKNKRAYFSIVIGDKKQWGKGYARECLKILKDFVFNDLGFNKFYLYVYSSNEKAIKIYKKFGFKTEAVLKKHVWIEIENKFEDVIIMSMFNNKIK